MIRHRTEIQDPPDAARKARIQRVVVRDRVFDRNRIVSLLAPLALPTARVNRRDLRRGGAAPA